MAKKVMIPMMATAAKTSTKVKAEERGGRFFFIGALFLVSRCLIGDYGIIGGGRPRAESQVPADFCKGFGFDLRGGGGAFGEVFVGFWVEVI